MSQNTVKKVTFGRIFWPCLVAIIVASIISMIFFFVILGGIIGSIASFTPAQMEVKKNTVLHMTLDGIVDERGVSRFNTGSFAMENKIGLSDILYGLEKAKTDDRVKGIYLELKNLSCGMAAAKEIRDAINDFESSGKFVVGYNGGEVVTQKEFYVSSAANENYGFPTSNFEFLGLGAELTFFKNTLDKLDIEMQVIRGKNNDFKSAVEPYFRTEMSDSSRLQLEVYLKSIWKEIRSDIAKERSISTDELDRIAENALIARAQDAVNYKLLDGTKYSDEILQIVAKKAGVQKVEDLNLVSFEKYAKQGLVNDQTNNKNGNVAVILAEGEITVDGDGLTSEKICKYLKEAREDKDIKTIVLRVNSPGGSALASDEIWREVKLANQSKKVIVSMGDVAASGGYYISSSADRIFAEPTTITGSIGVFGVIPYLGKAFENKLGLTFDRVQTNKHAVLSLNKKLSPEEFERIQKEVDLIYSQFLGRVSEGRGMDVSKVNAIARGRVWTGVDAKRIGLVDELGGIKNAVSYAAKQAGIKDDNIQIKYWPKKKENPWETVIETLNSDKEEVSMKTQQLPAELIYYYEQLKRLENMKGIQMRLPYDIVLH